MKNLVRGVVMVGVGVAIGAYWPKIRDEVLPRLTGSKPGPWISATETAAAR